MSVFDTDPDRVVLYERVTAMQGVAAVKELRAHLRGSLKESLDLARGIAAERPDTVLGRFFIEPPTPVRPSKGALTEEVEKLIAGCCFPSNPDMSDDPRNKLHGHNRRRVEECAEAIMDTFVTAGFQPHASD